MRVCIDCRYLRERPSGIGAYVAALVDLLPGLGPSDRFDLWAHPRAPRPLSRAPNVREYEVSGSPNTLATLLFPSRLGPTDGNVFHSPHNILGRGIRCATVVTVHDLMWLEAAKLAEGSPLWRAFRTPFFRAGIGHALRSATRLLTVSLASADAILRAAPNTLGRIVVTRHAPAPHFRPAANRDSSRERVDRLLGHDAPYFILVGQNAPSKGHPLALQAFAELARPGERLVLVQRRNPRRGLYPLARKLGISDRVAFLPSIPAEDLVALLHCALALLQPSLAEGFGMPVLEAMAAGCPVVASDIAPLREILGGAGLQVPSGDPRALARAMGRLSAEPGLREDMRARGIERASGFRWDTTAATTLEVYRDAAEHGPAGPGF